MLRENRNVIALVVSVVIAAQAADVVLRHGFFAGIMLVVWCLLAVEVWHKYIR